MSNDQRNELMALPAGAAARGIDASTWSALKNSLYPGAKDESVLMVLDYCKARSLDPLKKPCHIVPISVKDGDNWKYRDVVMPGIYEYRITAQRTGEYLGHSKPVYGPSVVFDDFDVEAPEWCEMTFKRYNTKIGRDYDITVRTYFEEVVATDSKGKANARWRRARRQMLTKCTEAAGLRELFPDELGGTHTDDEMYGREVDAPASKPVVREPSRLTEQARPTEPAMFAKDVDDTDSITAGKSENPGPREVTADRIIPSQKKLVEARLLKHNVPLNLLLAKFEIGAIDDLLYDDVSTVLAWVEKVNTGATK